VAAEEQPAAHTIAQYAEGRAEPFAIALGACGRRATARAGLAIRQVTTQDSDAARSECPGHGHQERRVGAAAGAVGEDKAVASGPRGRLQDAANGRGARDVNALDIHGGTTLEV